MREVRYKIQDFDLGNWKDELPFTEMEKTGKGMFEKEDYL